MALSKPFETRTFTVYAGDVWLTKLSFAVWIVDAFTQKNPETKIIVRVEEDQNLRPIKNASGYYCFTGLQPATYTVIVEPDPATADWYFPAKDEIDMEAPDFEPLNPELSIELKPKPSYPFPGNATLVRAVVRTSTKVPVEEATVTITGRPEQTKTDASGEFVLYFKQAPGNEVTINIRKGNISRTRRRKVEEGKTISLGVIDFP